MNAKTSRAAGIELDVNRPCRTLPCVNLGKSVEYDFVYRKLVVRPKSLPTAAAAPLRAFNNSGSVEHDSLRGSIVRLQQEHERIISCPMLNGEVCSV